jgi:hypothetical protein
LQLGCDTAAAKRGAFAFLKNQDGSLTANTFATVQAVPALAGKAYPVDGSSVDRPTVRMPCSVATPAPTTTSPAAPSPPVSSSPATVAPSVSAVTSSRAQGRVIPATGGGPGAPWDNAGLTVFGLGLLGYGLLALASSRAAARRH